ncbi:MAG: sulfotransferase [Alphaproteobacteria bacterium]|nr:sulfotransferase [Alphaproteobacteria bacterium]
MGRAEKRRQRKLAGKAAKSEARRKSGESQLERQNQLPIQQTLDLAVQHHTAGRLPEAKGIYQQILQVDPNQPIALHLLGVIAHQVGKNDIALELITKALAIKPDYAEAYNNQGNALMSLEQPDEAAASYRKAIAVKPDYAEQHNNLGYALRELGRLDEAVDCYRKALTIEPDFAEAYNNLGIALQELGRLDEVVDCYHKALAIKPDYAEAYRNMADFKKHSEYDQDIQAMEQAYAEPDISDEQRMHLAFGLGKAFEDLCRYEKAFGFFAEGNAIKRESYGYSVDDSGNFFKKIKEVFDSSLLAKHQDEGCHDKTPIFILGMPRSGTTLVEQILASHPRVHGAGELKILPRIVFSHFDKVKGVKFPGSIRQVDGADFKCLGAEYINEAREHSGKTMFLTDKMPDNYFFIGIIKLALPNAKVIHCKRNPADNCLSLFKSYFPDRGHNYAYDLVELGRYYNFYHDLMEHWHSVIPGFVHDIQYEDIVADQAGQTRTLLEYCGLEWDDACLAFHKTNRLVQTKSFGQVRKPIYKDSIQSWKRYENQLAPLLEIL